MQVLSTSVAEALHLTGGEEARETARFIEMFDKFFDCLNVNNFNSGKHKRKVFQDPFRPNDFRLKVRRGVLILLIFEKCVMVLSAALIVAKRGFSEVFK